MIFQRGNPMDQERWAAGDGMSDCSAARCPPTIPAGFETADSGSVTVNGRDVSHVPPARRDMGMVFQSYSLFPNMSALDNVAFGLRMRKKAGPQRRSQAAELLGLVGLAAPARQYPHQLSGGQQQRERHRRHGHLPRLTDQDQRPAVG